MASKPKKGKNGKKEEKISTAKKYKKIVTSFENMLPDIKIKQFKESYDPGEDYVSDYTPTEFTREYNPEKYDSKYLPQIEEGINNLTNWNYDPLQDASYQALAKVYGARGNIAAKNSLADAAALNGGYGTSYAVSAAQQARNQYNQELASLVPQLEQASYDRQAGATNMLMGLDDSIYGRFSDDETRKLQSLQYALDVAGFNEGNKQFAATHGLDVARFNDDKRRFKFSSDLDKFSTNWDAYLGGKEYQRSNITTGADMVSGYLGYKAATAKPKTGTGGGGGGRRSSIGGGGGIGGYTSTPTTTTPTYDSTKQSVIMGSGKNGQNVRNAKGLTTIKEKNKRSGGRVIL